MKENKGLKPQHVAIAVVLAVIVLGVIGYFLFFNPSSGSSSGNSNSTISASYPPVFLTVVSNFSNPFLNQTLIVGNLSSLIPNLSVSYVDLSSPEGLALQNAVNASFAPFYVFNASILNSPAFPSLLKVLASKPNGDYVLNSFETNQGLLLNNETQPFSLKLFVTPYDPHAWQAENNTYSFLSNFSTPVNFSIGYIVGLNGSNYVSLNGPNELEETALQVCLNYQNSTDLKFYLGCLNNQLYQNFFNTSNVSMTGLFYRAYLSAQTCAEGVGAYNVSEAGACAVQCLNATLNSSNPVCNANTSILGSEYQVDQAYHVIATPTYVFNNQYVHVGVLSPGEVQKIMCELNNC